MAKAKTPKIAGKSAIWRRTPVQEHSRQLADDILEATAQVLAEVGYERTSTKIRSPAAPV